MHKTYVWIEKGRASSACRQCPKSIATRFDYGRRFAFALAFTFEPIRFAFAFAFELVDTVAIGVAIGVGLDMMVLRFALLLLTLLFAASPQAMPSDPSANTAVSAIFFMILN